MRKDLIAQAGLKLPTTFDELLAVARATTRNGIYGIAMPVGPVPEMTVNFFCPYVYQSGWDYFDQEGNLTFDRPEVFDAVMRFVEIMKYAPPALYNGTFVDVLNFYNAGRVAMAVFPGRLGYNVAQQAPRIAAQTTVIPQPLGPFMTGKIFNGAVEGYSIARGTKDPALASAFLQYITTGSRALAFSMTVPGHLLPPLKSVARLQAAYTRSAFMNGHRDWVLRQQSWLPHAISPLLNMGSVHDHHFKPIVNICPWAAQIWGSPSLDGDMLQRILLSGESPRKAWKETAQAMKKIAETWKRQNPTWRPTS